MPESVPTKEGLEARFDFLAGKVAAPKPRRIWVEPPADRFREVLEHVVREMGCDHLCTITGLDEKETFVAVYHLTGAHGVVVNLKRRVPRERPVIQSVTDLFPGGANYERELDDLLGFVVEGLPPGHPYPLPEDWPRDQKPLRKDWKPAAPEAP